MNWKEEEEMIKKELEKKLEKLEKLLKNGVNETEIEKLFDEIREGNIGYNYEQEGWDLLEKYNPKLSAKIAAKITFHPTK